jgi:hypothetical protein
MTIAVLDRPWWELLLLGTAAAIVGLVLVVIALLALDDWRTKRKRSRTPAPMELSEQETKQMLAFPYYVDGGGLRTLATSLGIDLPLARHVTRSRKLSLSFRGAGGEGSHSVTSDLAGEIDLNRLAHELRFGRTSDRVAPGLGDAPYVSDEDALASAIETIERSLGETSGTSEALARVKQEYEIARVQGVADTKRSELQAAAAANSLVYLSGEFDRAPGNGSRNALLLVRFDDPPPPFGPDAPHYVHFASPYEVRLYERQMRAFYGVPGEPRRMRRDEALVPPGIAIEVVLPDDTALTPAGAERIGRGQPFYARTIAHSPSFDESTGTFVCSAYAVWGVTRT